MLCALADLRFLGSGWPSNSQLMCGVGDPCAEQERLVGLPLSVVCFINDDVSTGGVPAGDRKVKVAEVIVAEIA